MLVETSTIGEHFRDAVRVYSMNIAHIRSFVASQSPNGTAFPIIEWFLEIVLECPPAEYFSATTYLFSKSHLILKGLRSFEAIHAFLFIFELITSLWIINKELRVEQSVRFSFLTVQKFSAISV